MVDASIRRIPDLHRMPRLAGAIALAGCYIFAFFSPFSPTGHYLGMALVLMATLIAFPAFWNDTRRQPLFWLVLALAAYVGARSSFAFQEFPQLSELRNPKWTDFLQVLPIFALLLGWWFYRKPRHLAPIVATAILGTLVGIAYAGDWDRLLAGPANRPEAWRFAFGYNPNYLGLVASAGFIVSLIWLLNPFATKWRWLLVPPVLLALSILVFASQSRAAWMGLTLGLLATSLWSILNTEKGISYHKAEMAGMAFIGLLGVVAIVFWIDGWAIAANRLLPNWDSVQLVLSGQHPDASNAVLAAAYRVGIWLDGIQAFLARPWLGWGPGAAEIIPRTVFTDQSFAHFHNIYLEWLIAFGLFGFALAGACVWILAAAAIKATRDGLWSRQIAASLLGVGVATAVALLFSIRIGHTEGRAFLQLLQAFFILGVFRVAASRRTEQAAAG